MRLSLTLTLMLSSLLSLAQTYYVSSRSGDNSNLGTSQTQAWKNISAVNARMGSIPSGSTIRFKRGETFLGQLNVTVDNVTIGAYGQGSKPLIRATRWLGSNWVSLGGNLWEVRLPNTPERVRALYRNKESLLLGREPNLSDPVHKGYYYYESVTKDGNFPKMITDNDLTALSSEDWTGSEIMIRFNHWRLVVDTVESQSGGQLTIINPPNLFLPKPTFGYFFQNDIKTLDEQGEWAYDKEAGKIYLYSTTDPNTQSYSYASNNYAIVLDQASGVRVENLALMGSNQAALGINDSDNATADNLTINPSGYFGVHVAGSTGATISNCQIRDTNLEGIRVERESTGATITNNTLEDIALTAGMGQADGDGYSGMYILGADGTVENNTIRRTGYCGIRIDMYSGLVRRNFIEKICFVKDDGGAIYINDNNGTTTNKPIIEENIARQLIGNGAANGSDKPDLPEQAMGIYSDVNSFGSTIRYNTVSEALHGLYVNDSPDHLIYGNTVNGTARYAVRIKQDQSQDKETGNDESYENIRVYDNVLIETEGELNEQTILLENKVVPFSDGDNIKDLEEFGQYYNNYIVNPIGGQDAEVVNLAFKHDGSVYETSPRLSQAFVQFTAPGVDAFMSNFSNTQILPLKAPNPEPTNFKLFYSNPSNSTISQSLPGGSYVDATGTIYSGLVEIAPWRSVVLFKSSGLTQPPANAGGIDPNQWYHLQNVGIARYAQGTNNDDGTGDSCGGAARNVRGVNTNETGHWTQWRFVEVGNGRYYVKNRAHQTHLAVFGQPDPVFPGGSCGEDEAIIVRSVGDGCQGDWVQWELVEVGNGNYRLYHPKSDTYLQCTGSADVASGSGDGGVQLQQVNTGCSGNRTQWQLVAAGSVNARQAASVGPTVGEAEVAVYPNPARGVLQVQVGQGQVLENLSLSDLSGRVFAVPVHYGARRGTLTISSLSQGVYLLRGRATGKPFAQKVFVQN